MVLINELTVEQINAALLHLQRSKDEVVGGNKGTTIQNISVNNSGGGGNNVDYFGTIKLLARNIETNKDAIDKNTSDIASLKDDMKDIEKSVEETLQGLADNGISDLSFDPLTKQLTITTNDGDTFQTVITQDIGVLSYDSVNNKLVLTTGEQSQEITLPYIKTSEKGSANGVATLDENGRVPYSQLPESAMEFLGQWDASTNTPHLADGTGTNGDFYIVSDGGTVNLGTTQNPHIITFFINDRIVYEGDIAQWVRLPAGQVSSVNGQSGEVVLTASDINYSTGVTIKDKIDANAVQSDWSVTDSSSLAYIKNKPSLATVATSGSYTDLSNKPNIPAAQVNSDWNATTGVAQILNKPTLATVATSGKYCDLSDKPTLGTAAECNASCFRASTWKPNMNEVGNASDVYVAKNTVCRKIIMTNIITNVGFRTRVGIGLQRGTGGWGVALLSVGTNDAGTTFYDYKFSNTGVLTAACFCGDLDGIVTRCGSVNGGYYVTVPSPVNTTHYVLVDVGSVYGGNVVAQINTSKYHISKSNSSSRVVTDGANYGCLAYSHLGTEQSPSSCIWLRFTGWRPMLLCGEYPVTIVCNTTTAPSGVTFNSPVYNYANRLLLASGVSCTGTATDDVGLLYASYDNSNMPGIWGNVIQMQTGTGNTTRWGYQLAFPTNGCLQYRRWTNTTSIGGWNSFITSENISSQHVACADNASCAGLVYLDSYTVDCDRPIMVTCGRGTTGYSDQGVSTVCPLTFNPATGVLCAKCFCGNASCADHATSADSASSTGEIDGSLICSICGVSIRRIGMVSAGSYPNAGMYALIGNLNCIRECDFYNLLFCTIYNCSPWKYYPTIGCGKFESATMGHIEYCHSPMVVCDLSNFFMDYFSVRITDNGDCSLVCAKNGCTGLVKSSCSRMMMIFTF